MSTPSPSAAPSAPSLSAWRLVDADVHPLVRGGIRALFPYMPSAYRRRFELKGADLRLSAAPMRYNNPKGSVIRPDATGPDGAPGGSDPQFVREDLLDRHGVDCAILDDLESGRLATVLAGPAESVVLCSAFNDYYMNEWLPADPRFRYTPTLPVQDPRAAAAEVRRVAAHPGVAAVYLPPTNTLMGSSHYDPIYEEAVAAGLPIYVHAGGVDGIYHGAPAPIGLPSTYVERYIDAHLVAQANLTSLIFEGTFERFPTLRVILVEYGFAWALPLLWRMNQAWQGLRLETPWVQRRPSDYVRDHVRFATQPLDEPDAPADFEALVRMLGPELLVFSTDYPHWDSDTPGRVLKTLAGDVQAKIFAGNAIQLFRL